jgi:hypothetical protein
VRKLIVRNLLSLAFLPLLLAVTHSAAAQALPAGIGPGSYTTVGVAGSFFKSDYGQTNLYGLNVFVDANITRRVGIEAEARFLRHPGNDPQSVSMNTYMVGPRISLKPRGWVPYVKMPIGVAHMTFPYGYATGSYLALAPGAGLELWLPGNRVHIRLVDAEYQIWPQFTYGKLNPYGVSAGISIRVF